MRTPHRYSPLHRWAAAAICCAAVATSALPASASTGGRHRHDAPFSFGIYPGGVAGGGSPDPAPDDRSTVVHDLNVLQDARRSLVVREYTGYDGSSSSPRDVYNFLPYLGHGRRLDLVAGYSGHNAPLDGWLAYVRNIVRVAGPVSDDISLGVDVNFNAQDDPSYVPAVAAGVVAAKQEARRLGYRWLRIGFDEVYAGKADPQFWSALSTAGGPALRRSLDYVGVEVYPDIFYPQPGDHGAQAVANLQSVRRNELCPYGFGRLPMHVAENGWPTTPDHTPAQQADTIGSEVTAIFAARRSLGVDDYELFALRDNKTGTSNPVDNLGLTYDDYRPKPAFAVYRDLLRRLH